MSFASAFHDARSYPPPVNHLGIKQLGPIGAGTEVGIVFFFDPDEIKFQFARPQID